MPIERFFDPHLDTDATHGHLRGDEMHHALKVFRLKQHDKCEIINGHGRLAQVTLTEISKKQISYQINSSHQLIRPLPRRTLILGMPKFNRLEWIIEKVTELGCDEIILFDADRSEKVGLSANQLERLGSILQATLKQCGRLFLPTLLLKPHLEGCFESSKTYFYGDPKASHKLTIPLPTPVSFVIGPEGGFSDKELQLLSSKAQGILLSDAVLRVDTAAIVASFLMQCEL